MPKIINLASGSRGNCTLIKDDGFRALVDLGISALNLEKRLPVSADSIDAIFVTHEHVDHVMGIFNFTKKYHVPVYVHEKVASTLVNCTGVAADLVREFGDLPFEVNGVTVTPFRIPHDTVYPVGFTFTTATEKCGVATDLGQVTPGVKSNLEGCDTLLLESNHDVNMLLQGKYPPLLKRRILGNLGHLSNEDCATLLDELVRKNLKKVILGHLSENNNTPTLAFKTTEKILAMNGVSVNKDVRVLVANPYNVTQFD